MAKQTADKSKLQYDLLALKKGEQVLLVYPELATYPTFQKHGAGKDDVFLKFAIWYSDANSQFRDLAIDKKREQCLARAGVPKDHERYANVLAGKDRPVLQMIAEYVRLQDWLEYATLFHGREHIWWLISTLSMPITADDANEPEQKAIKGRNDSLTFALLNVSALDKRWKALWMNDADVQLSAQQDTQKKTLGAESRAENRKFIPKKANE